MNRRTVTFDASRKAVDAVADWLAARARDDASGAPSLAHLLVVVPTAQSGRRLRHALARRFPSGLVPPRVLTPAHLVDLSAPDVAGRADELLALREARGGKGGFDVAAELSDIRRILGANALSFADVAAKVGSILHGDLAGVESERWAGLAALEARYVAALARRGRRDRIAALKEALARRPEFPGVEEAVVACVLDPIPVMNLALEASGLPVTELLPDVSSAPELKMSQIAASGTAASEAAKIAAHFASVKDDEALPALCLADADMFPEVQGALRAKGLRVHRPSATPLATSSLGHLARQIAALARTSSYAVFSSFVRGGDVRRWLKAELKLDDAALTAALVDLDNRQSQLIPASVDDIAPKTDHALRAVFEFVKVQLRKRGPRQILKSIFDTLVLDERDERAREFAAAAEAVNELVDECFAKDVPRDLALELFERRLGEATYELEPDEGETILTDGWLELPFLDADEVVVSGFAEGKVPESVVGHAFLPDALRRALGLADNASRAARDRTILAMTLACRETAAVTVHFHSVDAAGDVLKPSRLLFDCADDAELVRRVSALYATRAGTGDSPAADLPERWRIRLPTPPEFRELKKTSPSSLDQYLHCPFTYILRKTFGESEDYRAEELDASEFGNLAHDALEAWGKGSLKDFDGRGRDRVRAGGPGGRAPRGALRAGGPRRRRAPGRERQAAAPALRRAPGRARGGGLARHGDGAQDERHLRAHARERTLRPHRLQRADGRMVRRRLQDVGQRGAGCCLRDEEGRGGRARPRLEEPPASALLRDAGRGRRLPGGAARAHHGVLLRAREVRRRDALLRSVFRRGGARRRGEGEGADRRHRARRVLAAGGRAAGPRRVALGLQGLDLRLARRQRRSRMARRPAAPPRGMSGRPPARRLPGCVRRRKYGRIWA